MGNLSNSQQILGVIVIAVSFYLALGPLPFLDRKKKSH